MPDYLNNIKFDNTLIKRINQTYLGVIIDENLKWKDHRTDLHNTLIKH